MGIGRESHQLVFELNNKNKQMDSSNKIKYCDDKSLYLINKTGKLRQLFVPFKVQCIKAAGNIKPDSWVYVEQVAKHHQFLILYKVFDDWIPYSYFRIMIHY